MLKGLCHDSGAAPTLGQTYLVQTHVTPRGSIYQLADCEQIRPVDQATSALEYLRSSQRGTAPTEVFGEATAYGSPSAKRFPLPQTKIHLKGENRQLDFLTDEDGRFHGIVKPGKYAFTAEFPAGYEADYLPAVITTIEHRCTQVSVAARSAASITAHIIDVDGDVLGPMSSVQLTLETAEDQQFVQSVYVGFMISRPSLNFTKTLPFARLARSSLLKSMPLAFILRSAASVGLSKSEQEPTTSSVNALRRTDVT